MTDSVKSEEKGSTRGNLQVRQTESGQTTSAFETAQEPRNESDLSRKWLSSKEKWFIVGLSGFAALFRYAALEFVVLRRVPSLVLAR
jgi:hypothetical protein